MNKRIKHLVIRNAKRGERRKQKRAARRTFAIYCGAEDRAKVADFYGVPLDEVKVIETGREA